MSYVIRVVQESVHIAADKKPAAYEALKAVVDKDVPGRATNFAELMKECRWRVEESTVDGMEGDVTEVEFTGSRLWNTEDVWRALAPFVTRGSFIEFKGEEDDGWRYVFDGEAMHEVKSKLVWDRAPHEDRGHAWAQVKGRFHPDEDLTGPDTRSIRWWAGYAMEAIWANPQSKRDMRAAAVDLLRGMRHWCDSRGYRFSELLGEATEGYEANLEGESAPEKKA